MAPATKRISQQELIEMIKDLDVSDEELAKYFIVDEQESEGFSPKVIANPDLLEQSDLEGAFVLNSFNHLARIRRNRKYRRRIKNWDGVRIVAEGDSWFQYPLLLKDTIDQLVNLDNFQYAIYGLSAAGDLLSNIVREDEISEAIERENPDVLLLSGGGNDMVGDGRMAMLVHEFSAKRKPENYPNEKFVEFLDELDRLYRGLFTRLLSARPHLKILYHGYDNAIPKKGPWLGRPLAKVNITNRTLQRQIVAVMIGRFNQTLQNISKDFPGAVYHVDCRKVVGTVSKWHDELHPKNAGFFKVAQRFDAVIKQALSEQIPSPAIDLNKLPGHVVTRSEQTVKLAKMQKLDHQDFLNLVVKRAELIMGKPVAQPKSRFERKQLEKDISDFFEKIHKEGNFLPSSFLENGVIRARSVCRIVTDSSYGSGFLIASRHFIMTNNHVVPDVETAEVSVGEFDYDQDDVEYSVTLNPDVFFITDKDLDFTIVACDPRPLPIDIQAIPLLRDHDTITRGERVNIIQHPRGRRKEISLHDNKINYVYDLAIRYTADTEAGSSGSPVFNNQWNLVALHHAGWSDADGSATNEGIRIAAIVDYLTSQNQAESNAMLESLIASVAECDDGCGSSIIKPGAPPIKAGARDSHRRFKSLTLNIEGNVEEITIKLSQD